MTESESPLDQPDRFAAADDRTEQFIQLLAEHERRLATYVMTLVPRIADAEDILQDTKLALWRSFDEFQLGTNFNAWARTVAYHRILAFRKRKAREAERVCFSEKCLAVLAETIDRDSERRDEQRQVLAGCVTRLPAMHREILTHRYREGLAVEEIAERVGRSVAATYRVLSRIRLALRDCVAGKVPGTTG